MSSGRVAKREGERALKPWCAFGLRRYQQKTPRAGSALLDSRLLGEMRDLVARRALRSPPRNGALGRPVSQLSLFTATFALSGNPPHKGGLRLAVSSTSSSRRRMTDLSHDPRYQPKLENTNSRYPP